MDAMAMVFNEGQRNLALELFQRVMAHCPEQYLKMAKEASEQEVIMNLFERLLYRRLCNEQPVDGGAAPAASETVSACGDNPVPVGDPSQQEGDKPQPVADGDKPADDKNLKNDR